MVATIIHPSKPVEHTTLRVKPKVNQELGVMMRYGGRIDYNTCYSDGDVDTGGSWVGVEQEYVGTVLSASTFCESETALKREIYLK